MSTLFIPYVHLKILPQKITSRHFKASCVIRGMKDYGKLLLKAQNVCERALMRTAKLLWTGFVSEGRLGLDLCALLKGTLQMFVAAFPCQSGFKPQPS